VTDACTKEIVICSLKVRRPLPLSATANVLIHADLGRDCFARGMGMLKTPSSPAEDR
jgi:hypothetical protein